jgi:transposase-like protein
MAKTRPPYSPGFRRQIVELVRASRDLDKLAREIEPPAQSIRHWVAMAERPPRSFQQCHNYCSV